MLDSPASVW